jgi:hypothetical protein
MVGSVRPKAANTIRIKDFHFDSQILTLVHAQPLWKFSWCHWATSTNSSCSISLFLLIISLGPKKKILALPLCEMPGYFN